MTLYKESVQDSKTIWPEKLLKKEYYEQELAAIQLLPDQTYPELCHVQDNILVEGICREVKTIRNARRWMPLTENKLAQSGITPSAMDQQQLLQEPELRNGNIGAPSSLKTFNTRDTNTDMCRLDHADIIGTVPDGQKDRR